MHVVQTMNARYRVNIMRLLTGKLFIAVNMKHSSLSAVAFILLALAGCSFGFHRSTHNDGFDFPSENVSKILIGKTTGDELIQMFGGPLAKYEVSENEERWKYSYSTGTEIEEQVFLTDTVQLTSRQKTLVILLKNGTVTNFTYAESSVPPGPAQ